MMNNEALLHAIIENAIDGIINIDQKGIIKLVNTRLCELFGYQSRELINQQVETLLHFKDELSRQEHVKNNADTWIINIIGKECEATGIKKDGSTFPVKLALRKVLCNDEVVFTAVIHDLSVEKKMAEQLMEYTNNLESVVHDRTIELQKLIVQLKISQNEAEDLLEKEKEINQARTYFVSMASHEFRSPLSCIQLSASLIERYFNRLDKEKIMMHLHKIKASVKDLTDILGDFLSVEQIEAGKIIPIYGEFDLVIFCEELLNEMRQLTNKKQKLFYNHSGIHTICLLDQSLLKYCLSNLISNAIKYSRDICLIELETKIDDKEYEIRLKDNGIGIPLKDQEHLFEAFFRADNTQDIPGTGLGLNIVQRYVKLMNGTIEFKSSESSGTDFKLIFPLFSVI
jgi:two-component system sensor kinase FixL